MKKKLSDADSAIASKTIFFSLRFNGVLVPCCPLEIRAQIGRNTKTTSKSTSVEKASNYRVDLSQLELVPADEPVSFAVRIPGGKRELIRVSVLSPSRNSVPVSLKVCVSSNSNLI